MSRDDEDRFRPRPGRIRSDARGGAATKSFFTRVRKIARQHGAAPPGASAYIKGGGSGGRARVKVGVRRGRGAAFVRGRTLGERGWFHRQPGARRVMVKSRSVRAAGKNGRAAAHLRYIQRDGTSRDGERGRLYSATQDRTDGDAFLDRGKDDRHQFRVIVSPEDGAELGDLFGFTRDLMNKLEGDLGTKLDWVAVNHFNTGHPHVHVIINGRDELGEDLVINGDYIARGIRERASELMTLELGPVTAIGAAAQARGRDRSGPFHPHRSGVDCRGRRGSCGPPARAGRSARHLRPRVTAGAAWQARLFRSRARAMTSTVSDPFDLCRLTLRRTDPSGVSRDP
jgi:hypothetical protein